MDEQERTNFTSQRNVLLGAVVAVWLMTLIPSAASDWPVACDRSSRPAELTNRGTFTSPYHPNYYSNNAECWWRLSSAHTTEHVKLDFLYFATELLADTVSIYDGYDNNAPKIVTISGVFTNAPRGIASKQRYMSVEFRSSASGSYKGFKAEFVSTTEPFVLTRLSGSASKSTEGRLEVYSNGQWGSVCNDKFDDIDASVACYGLGFGYTGKDIKNSFGAALLPMAMNGLQCNGNETSLAQCERFQLNGTTQFCSYNKTVSIACSSGGLTAWEIVLIVLGCLTGTLTVVLLAYIWIRAFNNRRQVSQPNDRQAPVIYTTSSDSNADYEYITESGIGPPAYTPSLPPAYESLNHCSICHVHLCANVILSPCGHTTFCEDCITRLVVTRSNCPTCQQRVANVVRQEQRY